MNTLLIQNFDVEGLGLHEQYLVERDLAFQVLHTWRGDPLPEPGSHDLVIVGGTPVCVRDCHLHPTLEAEREWLKERTRLDRPTLGICFGAQLLAHVLGAKVYANPVKEIGGYDVRLTGAGRSDPLLEGFEETFPVFHWHGDTFDIPPGADLLVEGRACRNQMFRLGSQVGVQFHIEITEPMALRWTEEYAKELEDVGKTADQVLEECRDRSARMTALAERFMDNLLGLSLT